MDQEFANSVIISTVTYMIIHYKTVGLTDCQLFFQYTIHKNKVCISDTQKK